MPDRIKLLLAALFFLSYTAVFTQVKIGNNPNTIDANSLLELESTDQGILIPRFALNSTSSASPLTAPVPEGMLVYSDGGSLDDGFYFWNGSAWEKFSTSESRDNFTLVKSESDFPSPAGGVISLAANSVYEINGTVTVSNKIDINGSYIIGQNATADRLVYTGSGELFTGSNGGTIKVLGLTASSGKLFNVDASSNAGQSLLMRDCIIAGCSDIGLVKGFNIAFFSVNSYVSNTGGVEFEDINYLLLNNMAWFPTNTGTFETLTGTFSTIIKLGGFSQPGTGSVGLDISGISAISHSAELKNTSFAGSGNFVNGTFSKFWEVNSGGLRTQTDEVANGEFYVSSASSTTISAVNTPVKVAGTTTSLELFRVTSPVNNRLVYNGTRTRNFKVTANMSFTSANNNQEVSFYIAKNGSVISSTRSKRKIGTGSDIGAMGIAGIVELAPGDYVELFVENNSGAKAVTVNFLNFSIQ